MLYLFEILTISGNRYSISCSGFSVRDLSYALDCSGPVEKYKVSFGANTCLTPEQFGVTSDKWVSSFYNKEQM